MSYSPDPKAGVLDPKAGALAPKGPGVLAAPNAGVLAAPKPPPNAFGCPEPNAVLVAPKVDVLGCAPKAGVDAAPKRGCTTRPLDRIATRIGHNVSLLQCMMTIYGGGCPHTWDAAPKGLGLPKEDVGDAWSMKLYFRWLMFQLVFLDQVICVYFVTILFRVLNHDDRAHPEACRSKCWCA